MNQLPEQIVSGITNGALYAILGVAIALVYRGTSVINFALGEIGLIFTFISWQLLQWGVPLYAAIVVGLLGSFIFGSGTERVAIRPLKRNEAALVVVTLGLFLGVNQVTSTVWQGGPFQFPSLFGNAIYQVGSASISAPSIGIVAVLVAELVGLWLLLRTRAGLALRGSAEDAHKAVLVGINSARVATVLWGASAIMATLSAMLIAPIALLQSQMMFNVVIFALAGATLGGLDSPWGAALGCVIVGLISSLAATYIPGIGSDLGLVVALVIIVAALVVKPTGLFGRAQQVRA